MSIFDQGWDEIVYRQYLKEAKMPLEIPRRARTDLYCPAEKAIRDAIDVVESMGADVRLTETVELLGKAKIVLADYVDEQIANCRPPFQGD